MGERTYAGILLRQKRLERCWSQEGLCGGICTVSYLSKIEQGKVAVSPEILTALFSRLETPWYNSPEDLAQGKRLTEDAYETLFAFRLDRLKSLLNGAPEELHHGPYAPDLLLLQWFCHGPLPDDALEPCLDNRQLALLRIAQGRWEEAVRLYPCGYIYYVAGNHAYTEGDATRALELLQTGYQLAASAGQARVMLHCRMLSGNCYANLHRLPEMLAHYETARRLAEDLGDADALRDMAYNIASTRLELGQYEESYAFFSKLENPNIMSLHKLAICCEKLGKTHEALSALDRAKDAPANGGVDRDFSLRLCNLVRCRLEHPDYLQQEEYGSELLICFQHCREALPAGYAIFHLPWLMEYHTARRQYRQAFELLRDFPGAVPCDWAEPG